MLKSKASSGTLGKTPAKPSPRGAPKTPSREAEAVRLGEKTPATVVQTSKTPSKTPAKTPSKTPSRTPGKTPGKIRAAVARFHLPLLYRFSSKQHNAEEWKAPEAWEKQSSDPFVQDSRPTSSASSTYRMPISRDSHASSLSLDLSGLQRDVKLMAAATPEIALRRIKEEWGVSADIESKREVEMEKKRWILSALSRNDRPAVDRSWFRDEERRELSLFEGEGEFTPFSDEEQTLTNPQQQRRFGRPCTPTSPFTTSRLSHCLTPSFQMSTQYHFRPCPAHRPLYHFPRLSSQTSTV